jgi:hypothetical protein
LLTASGVKKIYIASMTGGHCLKTFFFVADFEGQYARAFTIGKAFPVWFNT